MRSYRNRQGPSSSVARVLIGREGTQGEHWENRERDGVMWLQAKKYQRLLPIHQKLEETASHSVVSNPLQIRPIDWSLALCKSDPSTAARQAPLSMGFSGQKYWNG